MSDNTRSEDGMQGYCPAQEDDNCCSQVEKEETNEMAQEAQPQPEANETVDERPQLEEKITSLRKQLDESISQAQEYKELLQRVKAEFDNYRKRNAAAVDDAYHGGMLDAVKRMLPVLDNLERAVNAAQAGSEFKALLDGVNMILKQFNDILAKMGIEEIDALGKPFDPNLHDAVMSVERQEGQEANVVVEVLQKGYKADDKVLRHSLVKVSQ